jgi:hypothetical protein
MPDLNFQIEGAEPQRHAAVPLLVFQLRITDAATRATPIQTVMLRCQVRIEPARRRYSATEQDRLLDLFGTPERWGQTLRPMPWTNLSVSVPAFTGGTAVDLPLPCSSDFTLAATKYFDALQEGDIPLCFLFSGTIFYEAANGGLQVAQVPWEKEAYHRLPAATWQALIEQYYPNRAWLEIRKDAYDRLDQYRRRLGLATAEQALETLLEAADEPATP